MRLRPLGGAPLPPPRAHSRTPQGALRFWSDSWRTRRLLPEGRRGRRAEGLTGLNKTVAGGGKQESRGGQSGRGDARARARAPGPHSLSRLPARAQPCCRAPPASPRLITTAPGVRWPRADSAAIGSMGSAAHQDWMGGGALPVRGRGCEGRRLGRRRGWGQAAIRAFVPGARSPPVPAAAPAASIIQSSGGGGGGYGQEAAGQAGTVR